MVRKKYLGRKGIEPLIAYAIEFTAQPVIPTNGTFLYSLLEEFNTIIKIFFSH
jgi:hypothetical protein